MPFYFLHVHNALLDAWMEKFSHTSRFKRSDTQQSYRGSHDGQNLIPSGGATLCVSNSNKFCISPGGNVIKGSLGDGLPRAAPSQ